MVQTRNRFIIFSIYLIAAILFFVGRAVLASEFCHRSPAVVAALEQQLQTSCLNWHSSDLLEVESLSINSSHGEFQTLRVGDLAGLLNLKHFSISMVPLLHLESGSLNGLSVLETIQIGHTGIQSVPPELLNGLPRLWQVDFSDNLELKDISPDTFLEFAKTPVGEGTDSRFMQKSLFLTKTRVSRSTIRDLRQIFRANSDHLSFCYSTIIEPVVCRNY